MTKDEYKRHRELNQITQLLKEIGVNACDCQKIDRPDIHLILPDSTYVGIEVTQYSTGESDEAYNVFNDILDEYASVIDSKSMKRYRVSVIPKGLSLPTYVKFKNFKTKIFEELELFRSGIKPDYSKIEFIDNATFYEDDLLVHTSIGLTSVIENGKIDESLIHKRIAEKNRKLANYKLIPKNINIQEYWLSIYVDVKEGVDILNVNTPMNISSGYDRIYICDSMYCKRLK